MGDININLDGLAKIAEIISYAWGWTAHGKKKMLEAEAYGIIVKAKAETEAKLLSDAGGDMLERLAKAKNLRRLMNVLNVTDKATKHIGKDDVVSDEPVNKDWAARYISAHLQSSVFTTQRCS